jgi:hypothetical protein
MDEELLALRPDPVPGEPRRRPEETFWIKVPRRAIVTLEVVGTYSSQSPTPTLPPRLRLSAPSLGKTAQTGTLVGLSEQTLTLQVQPDEAPIAVPVADIARLDVLETIPASTGFLPGARVRVDAPELGRTPRIATLVAMDDTRVTLWLPGEGRERSLPLPEVRKLEVSQGKHPHPAGGILGALAGGVGASGIAGSTCHTHGSDDLRCFGRSVFAFLPGAVVGAVLGSVLSQSETWKPIATARHADLRIDAAPQASWRASLSIGF